MKKWIGLFYLVGSLSEIHASEQIYVGNYWTISNDISQLGPYKFFDQMMREGNDNPIVILNTPGSSIMGRKIIIRDPAAVKEIFTTYLKDYTTKERSFMAMRRLLGELALLTSDPSDYHMDKKKNFEKYFGPKNIDNFIPIMKKQTERIIEKWAQIGAINNLYSEIRDATLGVIKDITFGIEDGDNNEMGHLLENAIKISSIVPLDIYFQALYFQKFQHWYISWAYPDMKMYSDKVHAIMEKLFYQSNPDIDTYLNFLKKERNITDTPDDELINDLLTAYLGGHDTTTTFLTFIFEHLAFNSQLQEDIHNEIKNKMGEKLASSKNITRHDLSKANMPILDKFIEAFPQIVPPVGASGRDVIKEFTLTMPNYSFDFKLGDQILFPIENLYDSSYNKFVEKDLDKQIKLSFMNGSAHTCPGQIFAKTEAKIFIISLLWKYKVDKISSLPAERENRGTIIPKTPIKLQLVELHDA